MTDVSPDFGAVGGLSFDLLEGTPFAIGTRTLVHEIPVAHGHELGADAEVGTCCDRKFAGGFPDHARHREAFIPLAADAADLRLAGLHPERVHQVRLTDGDTQNGGCPVLVLIGDDGPLGYQPRPVNVDVPAADVVPLLHPALPTTSVSPLTAGAGPNHGRRRPPAPPACTTPTRVAARCASSAATVSQQWSASRT